MTFISLGQIYAHFDIGGIDVFDTSPAIDPMFPPRDKSAAVKKEMALLQWLLESETGQSDAAQLLAWALEQDVARVVVKRPARAQPLAGAAPSHCLQGKAVRFDVYVRRSLG